MQTIASTVIIITPINFKTLYADIHILLINIKTFLRRCASILVIDTRHIKGVFSQAENVFLKNKMTSYLLSPFFGVRRSENSYPGWESFSKGEKRVFFWKEKKPSFLPTPLASFFFPHLSFPLLLHFHYYQLFI